MANPFSVTLAQIIKEFSLETIYMPEEPEKILVYSSDVNRPGLQLNGFFEYFDSSRIQIIGKSESAFLDELTPEKRREIFDGLCSRKPPALVLSRSLDTYEEMLEMAERDRVPVLRTDDATSAFTAGLISYLNTQLAPRITRHGVLVEVYGEGVLLLGDSGVGKSETAIELVKRGHRLIADDAVEIRRVSSRSLVGTSPENIRHFVELRGIGIINARRIFGMGAVKVTEKIDMIIQLEQWNSEKVYDRMGMESETGEILGIRIPQITIPVKPGRNLAIIIEVAAMNNRQKKMGYNAAQELLINLGMLNSEDVGANTKDWSTF